MIVRLPLRRHGAWLVLDLDDAITWRAAVRALVRR